MGVSTNTQILIDTTKRAIIKRVGVFDAAGGDEPQNLFLDPRTLSGVLDANGNLWRSGNTLPPGFGGCLTVKRIVYNADVEVGHIQLKWEGQPTPANDRTIWAFGAGNGDTNPNDNLPVIWNNALSPSGNIAITTVGTLPNSTYTMIVEFHKDGRYFQAGQFNDPAAFNFTPFGRTP